MKKKKGDKKGKKVLISAAETPIDLDLVDEEKCELFNFLFFIFRKLHPKKKKVS